MQDAKVPGNFTNHSLRATGATMLFNTGVTESILQKQTGHKSLRKGNSSTGADGFRNTVYYTDESHPISDEDAFFMNSIPNHAFEDFDC